MTGWRLFALLVAVAALTRATLFGNPIAYSDEQFYTLVGEMLSGGALPYVDIWDRKPVGLFLLYAAMGWFGPLAYQGFATVFAAATAFFVTRLASRLAAPLPAALAGIAYLLWLPLGAAGGGQTPLFYNLPMALAGLLVVRVIEQPARLLREGSAAIALAGLALQIKYTAVFEGLFFGLVLTAFTWARWRWQVMPLALAWAALALMPTAAALAAYAALGHADAFIYANFVSALARPPLAEEKALAALAGMTVLLLPLVAGALLKLRRPLPQARLFLLGWLGVAIAGVLIFGDFTIHYVLPVLVPATAAAAPLFTEARRAGLALLVVAAIAGQVGLQLSQRGHGSVAQFDAIAALIDTRGCLFVHLPYAALYRVSAACRPTRYLFPSHLYKAQETGAIGVDQAAEVARIMASRPLTVLDAPYHTDYNKQADQILKSALARDYRRVAVKPLGKYEVSIYRLNRPSP